jgi:hypothetical protein
LKVEDRSENVSDELSLMIEEQARSGLSRAARGNREEMEARSTRREAVGQLANGSGRFGKGDMCGVEDARVAMERVSMTCVVLGPETD